MRKVAFTALLLFLFHSDVSAAGRAMTEASATAKAIAILKGDPYGATNELAGRSIRQAALVQDGTTGCGRISRPVWSFHVVVQSKDQPINGFLDIDASNGAILCASLPFLD